MTLLGMLLFCCMPYQPAQEKDNAPKERKPAALMESLYSPQLSHIRLLTGRVDLACMLTIKPFPPPHNLQYAKNKVGARCRLVGCLLQFEGYGGETLEKIEKGE